MEVGPRKVKGSSGCAGGACALGALLQHTQVPSKHSIWAAQISLDDSFLWGSLAFFRDGCRSACSHSGAGREGSRDLANQFADGHLIIPFSPLCQLFQNMSFVGRDVRYSDYTEKE